MCLENVLPMLADFVGLLEGPEKLSGFRHSRLRQDNRSFINCRQRNAQ